MISGFNIKISPVIPAHPSTMNELAWDTISLNGKIPKRKPSTLSRTRCCDSIIRKRSKDFFSIDVVDDDDWTPASLARTNSNKRMKLKTSKEHITNRERVKHLSYLIQPLLPFLEQICEVQAKEEKYEAELLGNPIGIPQSFCNDDERMYCCPKCGYELCLGCCQDIRNGRLTSRTKIEFPYRNRGYDYMHGGEPLSEKMHHSISSSVTWHANTNGTISCPPKELGLFIEAEAYLSG